MNNNKISMMNQINNIDPNEYKDPNEYDLLNSIDEDDSDFSQTFFGFTEEEKNKEKNIIEKKNQGGRVDLLERYKERQKSRRPIIKISDDEYQLKLHNLNSIYVNDFGPNDDYHLDIDPCKLEIAKLSSKFRYGYSTKSMFLYIDTIRNIIKIAKLLYPKMKIMYGNPEFDEFFKMLMNHEIDVDFPIPIFRDKDNVNWDKFNILLNNPNANIDIKKDIIMKYKDDRYIPDDEQYHLRNFKLSEDYDPDNKEIDLIEIMNDKIFNNDIFKRVKKSQQYNIFKSNKNKRKKKSNNIESSIVEMVSEQLESSNNMMLSFHNSNHDLDKEKISFTRPIKGCIYKNADKIRLALDIISSAKNIINSSVDTTAEILDHLDETMNIKTLAENIDRFNINSIDLSYDKKNALVYEYNGKRYKDKDKLDLLNELSYQYEEMEKVVFDHLQMLNNNAEFINIVQEEERLISKYGYKYFISSDELSDDEWAKKKQKIKK